MNPLLYQQLIKLSTKTVNTWTPQELASVLVFNGFSFERAKLFYDAQCSGADLQNILRHPTHYSYNIPKFTYTSFTFWIQQTFFRFWSKEQTEIMLKQNKQDLGMNLSDTDYKNQYSELSGVEIGQIMDSEKVEERYKPIKEWIHKTRCEESIIPLLRFTLLTTISTCPEYSHSIPYQNNRMCVRSMGNALLHNLTTPEARFKYLVCNFAYFGFGKTRLGVEFQKLFRNALSDNETKYTDNKTYSEYLREQYSTKQIESLQNANMVYINCINYPDCTDLSNIIISNIVKQFDIPPPPDSMTIKEWISTIGPVYIVLDEFQLFVSKQADDRDQIRNYYNVWNDQIRPLQDTNNVFLYICGKGILFELIGKGFFRAVQTTSPTLVHSVQLGSLDLNGIMLVLHWLNISNDFISPLAEYLLKKTGGIPILIHFAVMSFNINLPTLEETLRRVDSNLNTVPIQFIKPISSTIASKGLANIYRVIVWASILKKTFVKNEEIDVASLSIIPEFKEIQKIDISQLSLYCNNEDIEEENPESLNTWPGVIKYLKSHPLQLFKFKTASSSPDSIMYINQVKHYLCFQEKNESDVIDFTTLKEEVCKTIPLLESAPRGVVVILVILARSGCVLKPGVYTDEKILAKKHKKRLPENNEIIIPQNFYLVIPLTAEFEQFIGKMNAKALSILPKLKKQNISLSDALELVVPGAEVFESPSKKKK